MEVVSQLEGAFALLIRSTRFPDQLMAAKKGSPLLLGNTPGQAAS
jgi:glutamine---fructose-6-phosphate transaminase (isomerizing)